MQAWELALPKFAGDPVRAVRGYTEGQKTSTGRQYLDEYSAGESAWQAIGFVPGRKAQVETDRNVQIGLEKRITERKGDLVKQWQNGDSAERRRLEREEIPKYNKEVGYDSYLMIKYQNLYKGLTQADKDEAKFRAGEFGRSQRTSRMAPHTTGR